MWYPNSGPWNKAIVAIPSSDLVLEPGKPGHRDLEVTRGGWLSVGIERKAAGAAGSVVVRAVDPSGRLAHEMTIELMADRNGCGASFALIEGNYRVQLLDGSTVLAEKEITIVDGTPASVHFE